MLGINEKPSRLLTQYKVKKTLNVCLLNQMKGMQSYCALPMALIRTISPLTAQQSLWKRLYRQCYIFITLEALEDEPIFAVQPVIKKHGSFVCKYHYHSHCNETIAMKLLQQNHCDKATATKPLQRSHCKVTSFFLISRYKQLYTQLSKKRMRVRNWSPIFIFPNTYLNIMVPLDEF